MKSSFTVAVDIDGVLAETQIHLLNRANVEFGTHMTKDDLVGWNPKIGSSTFEELIERYLLDPSWVMGMPVVEGAREGLAAVRRVADVMIATTTVPETEHVRAAWVEENFGFKPVLVNTWGTGKAGLPADVLVDDYESNLHDFVDPKPGRVGILLNQPWNRNAQPHPKIRRAWDWREVANACLALAPSRSKRALSIFR
jgi:5'(3')-deoxyribonucleotidase